MNTAPGRNQTSDLDDEDALDDAFASAFASGADGSSSDSQGADAASDGNGFSQADDQGQRFPTGNGAAQGNQDAGQQGEQPTIEQLQKQLADRQAYERVLNGRLSAADRAANELRQQLAQANAAQRAAATTQAPNPADDEDEDDALRDAPDLEKAVQRRVAKASKAVQDELQQTRQQLAQMGQLMQATQQAVAPIHDAQRRQLIGETHAAMDEMFSPAWRESVRGDKYAGWLEQQPQAIRDLAEAAITPKETAQVLRLFFSEHGFPEPQQGQQQRMLQPAPGQHRAAPTQRNPAPVAQQAYARPRLGGGIPSRAAPQQFSPDSEQALDAAFSAAFRGG